MKQILQKSVLCASTRNKLQYEPISGQYDRESGSLCYDGICHDVSVRGTASTREISNKVLVISCFVIALFKVAA